MNEILLEAKVRWESHIEVNIKMVREKGVKGKKHKFQKRGILRCNICGNIFNFVRGCPDYVSGFRKRRNEIKL